VCLSLSPFLHRYLGVRDKNVANIIYCTRSRQIDGFQHLCQHAGNQNRIHGTMQSKHCENVAGTPRGCMVLLVLVVKWVMVKTIETIF
jgi:hypothetical protein